MVDLGHQWFLHRVGLDASETVGTNSENGNNAASLDDAQAVAAVLGIPQGPTFTQGSKSDLAEAYSPQAERSYADVVRDNRSTHSIELIK